MPPIRAARPGAAHRPTRRCHGVRTRPPCNADLSSNRAPLSPVFYYNTTMFDNVHTAGLPDQPICYVQGRFVVLVKARYLHNVEH